MFEYIKQLYDNKLWSNLQQFGSLSLQIYRNQTSLNGSSSLTMAMESSEQNTEDLCLKPKQCIQLMVMLAEANYECKEYRRAIDLLNEAFELKKKLFKSSKITKESEDDKIISEVEIKFKMHLCYIATDQSPMATRILHSIPAKLRTPKVNLSLGKLYREDNMERAAGFCLKEVLKACPLSLEAIQTLMQMGVKAKEIQELTLDATINLKWFKHLIQAYSHFYSQDFNSAVTAFEELDNSPMLHDDINILVHLGRAHFYNGSYFKAISTFNRIRKLSPYNLAGMDCLASCLCRESKNKELESLAFNLVSINEEAPEAWVAMGYFCYLNSQGKRAMQFSQKALSINKRNIEGLILKGIVHFDLLNQVTTAASQFQEIMQLAPYRFEAHFGLASVFLFQKRYREALTTANRALQQFNSSTRSLFLFATVLVKDPYQISLPKAKTYLEKALSQDPHYLPALYLLCEVLDKKKNYTEAIELLDKQAKFLSTYKIHRLLADFYFKTKNKEKALEHYSLALNMNPKNPMTHENLNKIEQSFDGPTENPYDLEMLEVTSDQSETEAIWSDGDANLTHSNNSF